MGFAKYDAAKVQKVLEAVDANERKMYYADMGVTLENVTSLESALKLSGLDYTVEKRPLQFLAEKEQEWNGSLVRVTAPFPIVDQYATVRTDTMDFMGIVGKNYEILQNQEAFDFLDSMVLNGAKFETAGSFGTNGAKNFITMSTEPMKILDDDFLPTMMFLNSHDGSKAIQVMYVNVRIFCSNCIARARKGAENRINIRHSRSMNSKLDAARYVLLEQTHYLEALKKEAEKLATTPFTKAAFESLARELFPVNETDSELVQIRNLAQVEQLLKAYNQDDLANFHNTAWGAIQAVADFESHPINFRKTKTSGSFTNVAINAMPLLNMVWERVAA